MMSFPLQETIYNMEKSILIQLNLLFKQYTIQYFGIFFRYFFKIWLEKIEKVKKQLVESRKKKQIYKIEQLYQEGNYQFYYQQLSSLPKNMMRKNHCNSSLPHTHLQFSKDASHSVSTQESPRQMNSSNPTHKQKSQLCKKFIENGYCPYEKKCKFAHGLHELKKNQQTNSKYKTKTCGGFLQEGYCPYGNRCNFIHPPLQIANNQLSSDDFHFTQIKLLAKKQSRLLQLLSN